MKRTMNKILALAISVMMLFSMIPVSVAAQPTGGWTTYTVEAWSDFGSEPGNVWEPTKYPKTGGTIILPQIVNANGTAITIPNDVSNITIKGSGYVNDCRITLASGRTGAFTLTLDSINMTSGMNQSAIDFTNVGSYGSLLKFKGTNIVEAGMGTGAAICIPVGVSTKIDEAVEDSDAVLNAFSAYGEGDTLSSTGAAIGSPMSIDCGDIEILGGIVNATAKSGSAGIGSGRGSGGTTGVGTVTISGGTVTAIGGDNGAGIGGGWATKGGTVNITGGTVSATGGESAQGIGPGAGGQSNTVTISGGTISANGGSDGAGISAGFEGTIDISGGTITANGSSSGAGIGGSRKTGGGTINISAGTIVAQGGYGAAGIGGGYGEDSGYYDAGGAGDISISGGTITATGGGYAAGIGNGWCVSGKSGNVIVTGSPSILAVRGYSASDSTWDDIGLGKDGSSSPVVTFSDGNEGDLCYVRFHVDTAIAGATITIGEGETTELTTDANGDAAFYVPRSATALPYVITKSGYKNSKGSVTPSVVSITKYVTMVEGESDVTAPSFTTDYPKATDVGESKFTLKVSSNEAGKAYYKVVDYAADAPTSAEVKAAAHPLTLTAKDTEYTTLVSGLATDSSFDVYVVVEDAEGNLSAPSKILVITLEADETAPAFLTGFPKILYITEMKAILLVQAGEDSEMFFYLQTRGGTAPDEETIVGQGSVSCEKSLTKAKVVYGLDPDTGYDVYVMLEDASGNRSAVVKLSIRTLADNSAIITITDADLLDELLDAGVDENGDAKISREEASNCSYLDLDDTYVSDLTGLEYFYYLEELSLEENEIVDISALSDKPLLWRLSLEDNSITDVSVLVGLTSLEYLNLSYNLLTSIESLAGLHRLNYLALEMNYLDISEGSSTRNLIDSFVESGAETFYDPQLLDLDIDYDVGSPSITDVTGEGFTLTVAGGPGTTSAIDSELGDFDYWAGYYVMKHNDEEGYLSDEDAFDWVWWDGEWDDLWYNEDTERYECTFTIDGLDPETEYDVYTLIEVKDDDTNHSYVSVVKYVSATTSEVEAELSPTPTEGEEPSPTDGEEPSPTDGEEPTPTDGEEPTPTDEADPTPTVAADPTPTVAADPTPTGALDPTPTVAAEATLIEAEEGAGSVEGEHGTKFAPGTEFVIEKVTAEVSESDMTGYTAGVKLLVDGKEINEVYEIQLLLNGQPVQPDGSVTVRIKLTAEQKALGGLQIVYMDDHGVVTLIDSTVVGDYIVFTTDHFSTYGLLANDVSPNPGTGDGGTTATVLFLLAAAGALMLARRRSAAKGV